MNKKKLLALLAKKEERKKELVKNGEASESVKELRDINKEVDIINEEIRSLNEILEGMEEDDETEERTSVVNSNIPGIVESGQSEERKIDEDGLEYRQAFRDLVLHNTPIPAELRADEVTKTTDVGSAIPTVLVNKIVEKLESTGMILPLVTRTSFAAGVNIPTSSVKPVATWVGEGEGSDKQKKTTGVITFTHHKLRCEVAMTMEVGTMAISAFESAFVRNVAEAMVKAIEQSIISGAWNSGKTALVGPKGILDETPSSGQSIGVDVIGYDTLIRAEAAIPQAYENSAKWCMTKKTFMAFVGMVDNNGQPIARVDYGIGGRPERTLLGRDVVLCGDYMDSYSEDMTEDDIFAFIFNFADYSLNTVYDMGIQKRQNWDNEDYETKAVMAVDGKVVDKNSLVVLVKKDVENG